MQDIELRSETGGEIGLCNLKRFVGRLDTFRCRFEHGLSLFEIEKRAPHFGRDPTAGGFERGDGGVAAGTGCLHSSFCGEAVEDVPCPVHPDQITVVEFRADQRIALIVNFVAGKSLDVRPQFASVDQILSIFDFDIYLARPDFGAVHIGSAKTFV